jgi:hypothetical protein
MRSCQQYEPNPTLLVTQGRQSNDHLGAPRQALRRGHEVNFLEAKSGRPARRRARPSAPRPLVASAWPEAAPRSAAAPAWTLLGFRLAPSRPEEEDGRRLSILT